MFSPPLLVGREKHAINLSDKGVSCPRIAGTKRSLITSCSGSRYCSKEGMVRWKYVNFDLKALVKLT